MNEEQIKSLMRATIQENILEIQSSLASSLPTELAARRLGYENAEELLQDIESGLLRVGIEVEDRRSPNSQFPDYYFNIEACHKRYRTPPEERD